MDVTPWLFTALFYSPLLIALLVLVLWWRSPRWGKVVLSPVLLVLVGLSALAVVPPTTVWSQINATTTLAVNGSQQLEVRASNNTIIASGYFDPSTGSWVPRQAADRVPLRPATPSLIAKQLLLLQEDRNFFVTPQQKTFGLDRYLFSRLKAIGSGLLGMATGNSRGGSGIYHQFIQRIGITNKSDGESGRFYGLRRKYSEEVLSLVLANKQFPPLEAASIVLKNANFGFNIEGFAEAARVYFNKRIERLTFAETAFLISIVPNPKQRYACSDNCGALWYAKQLMADANKYGIISKEQLKIAMNELRQLSPAGYINSKSVGIDGAISLEKLKERASSSEGRQVDQMCNVDFIFRELNAVFQKNPKLFDVKGKLIINTTLDTRLGMDLPAPPEKETHSILVVLNPAGELLHAQVQSGIEEKVSTCLKLIEDFPLGSTIKPLVALNALQNKVITPQTKIEQPKGLKTKNVYLSRHNIKTNLKDALYYSDNIFFARLCALEAWQKTAWPMFFELLGKSMPVNGKINPLHCISIGLGSQDEQISASPLRVASLYLPFIGGGKHLDGYRPTVIRSIATEKQVIYQENLQYVRKFSQGVVSEVKRDLQNAARFRGPNGTCPQMPAGSWMKTGTYGDSQAYYARAIVAGNEKRLVYFAIGSNSSQDIEVYCQELRKTVIRELNVP
jgi:membrane peptidoglycan carboxypeptidase